tara:strand:- start:118 stop:948 length:831 start_codon:yes stop_codon:yes gene_type:complete
MQGIDFNAVDRTGAGEPIITSRMAGILICYGLYYSKKKILRIRVFFGLLGFLIVVLTGTRTLFLSFTVLILISSFIDFRYLKFRLLGRRTKKRLLLYITLSLLIILSFKFNIFSFSEELLGRFYNSFTLLNNHTSDNSTMERLDQWYSSLEILFSHPFFGIGLGGFGFYYYGYDLRLYPHNIFLEVIAEGGLIAFILLLYFLFTIWKSFKTNIKKYRIPEYLVKFIFSLLFIGVLTSFSSLEFPNQFVLFNAISLVLAINGFQYKTLIFNSSIIKR